MGQAIVIDGERTVEIPATERDDTLLVAPGDLERATGWALTPVGLCRDDVCVPGRDHDILLANGKVDLRAVADALGRPMALEPDPPVAVLGSAAAERVDSMAALEAPAFTLPDIDGAPVSLADFAGRKKLLLAWASW